MKKLVHLNLGERSYDIVIEPGARNHFAPESAPDSLLTADSRVAALYPDILSHFPQHAVFPAGEESKTFQTVEDFCRAAARFRLDRKCVFYALGGGVCGDLTGFAAAVYMRGAAFVQLPTTLLAMVDSSVGGKTGADLPEGKNLIGAFLQPKKVWIDPEFLDTLPPAEIRCGMAEAVKTGVIFDESLFERIERSPETPDFPEIIERCCRIKGSVVERDERESGLRAILNYGHTFGHAVEGKSNFTIPHGDAVAIGMTAAAQLAVRLGLWRETDAARQRSLLEKLHLPVGIASRNFDPAELLEIMRRDKKNANGQIRLVLPEAIGKVRLVSDVPDADIRKTWEDLLHA